MIKELDTVSTPNAVHQTADEGCDREQTSRALSERDVNASAADSYAGVSEPVPTVVPALKAPADELAPSGSRSADAFGCVAEGSAVAGDLTPPAAAVSPVDMSDLVTRVIDELEARRSVRDARGRFAPGSTTAIVDGRRSDTLANALAEPKRELVAQVTADQGLDAGALPATLGRLVDAFAEASLLRQVLFATMAGRPTSAKGHARRLLSAWLSLVDREQRLAQAIGLERKASRPRMPWEGATP